MQRTSTDLENQNSMKASYYNHIIYKDDASYWFNALTLSCFKTTLHIGKLLEKMLYTKPSLLQTTNAQLYDKLLSKGFIIDDGINEKDIVLEANAKKVEDKNYLLVIMPTLNCNFKCWYCIQNHVQSKMSIDTMQRLKRHIDYMIDVEKINSLHIEWFGGEPFMYLDDIVKPLSLYAISKCEASSIPFINTATTNAYYLTPDRIRLLEQLQLSYFQITIDGIKEKHDKVKFQEGCISAFDHVLNNINQMLSKTSSISVLLRFNYTHNNLDLTIIDQLNNRICDFNRNRVIIHLKKVWQEEPDKARNSFIQQLSLAFIKAGYRMNDFEFVKDFVPCYVSRRYYNSICYNGQVFKCSVNTDMNEGRCHGILNKDGTITLREDMEAICFRKNFLFDKCIDCKFLPVCMGQCPKFNSIPDAKFFCKMRATNDGELSELIINYIEREYAQHNNI